MKNLGIVYHARPAYKPDFTNLVTDANLGDNRTLVMIGTPAAIAGLSTAERNVFADIIEIPDTTLEASFAAMEKIVGLTHLFNDSDDVTTRISTIAEADLVVVASLRDAFRTTLNIVGPGVKVTDSFIDKTEMKRLMKQHGVRFPAYQFFDKVAFHLATENYLVMLEETLHYPMFVKPINGASSIGTKKIDHRDDLLAWCTEHKTETQEYEIDSFIDGRLFHCDSINVNGKPLFTLVGQYLHPNADARQGFPLVSMTMDSQDPLSQRLKAFAENALMAFPVLPDGCTHLELFVTGEGDNEKIYFLEVGGRPSGARGPEMYALRTGGIPVRAEGSPWIKIQGGIDLRLLHTRLCLGMDIDQALAVLNTESQWGSYACMWDIVNADKNGILVGRADLCFESVMYVYWYSELGSIVKAGESNITVLGSVLLANESYKTLMEDFFRIDAQNKQVVMVAPVGSPAIKRADNATIPRLSTVGLGGFIHSASSAMVSDAVIFDNDRRDVLSP